MKKTNLLIGALSALVATGGALFARALETEPQKSPAAPRATLYCVVPNHEQLVDNTYAFYGSIDLATGKVTQLRTGSVYTNGTEYDSQTAAVRDGILYIPAANEDMVTGDVDLKWKRIDLKTGEVLTPIQFGNDYNAYCYSLAYDPEEDMFYGLSIIMSPTFSMGNFVKIDPKTWETAPVQDNGMNVNLGGTENDFMGYICYCPIDKSLYGIMDNGQMYRIDKTNGEKTLVNEFNSTYEEAVIPDYGAPSPLVYSALDRAFVTIWRDGNTQTMRIAYIDADTYEVTVGKTLSLTSYVVGLFDYNEYAEPKAPGFPVIDSFDLKDASLSGSVTFTVPTELYDGSAATGNFDVKVEMDGKTLLDKQMAPGATEKLDFTVAEGNHNLEIRCYAGQLQGPAAEKIFYAGNDLPVAPTGLEISENHLTWTPCGAVGANDGYVDTSALTYDVYVDDVKENASPLKETSYELKNDKSYARHSVTVTATANGKTSEPSKAVSAAYGQPLELPLEIVPTVDDYYKLTIVDANHDGAGFNLIDQDNEYWLGLAVSYTNYEADDWVFLPLLEFPDEKHLYEFSFNLANFYTSELHLNDIDIMLGSQPAPEAMTDLVYSHTGRQMMTPEKITFPFAVKQPGAYYIGIHAKGEGTQYRGVRFNHINVSSLDKRSSDVPAWLEDVSFAADKDGDWSTILSATAPTLNMIGQPLPSDQKLTVTATCGDYSNSVETTPGAAFDLEVIVDKDGFSDIVVTLSNANGENAPKMYTTYVGLDTPLAPEIVSVVPSKDNLSLTVTWKAPTQGVNGGYIDPDKLRYIISTKYSIQYTKVGESDELSYIYSPGTDNQTIYEMCVQAYNYVGTSAYSVANPEQLGTPYEIPMIETFGKTGFDYKPWRYSVYGDFKNFEWSSQSYMTGFGIGDPTSSDGMLICSNDEGLVGAGELPIPKVSTVGVSDAYFGITYWEYDNSAQMELWGRTSDNNELVKIADIPVGDGNVWTESSVQLPEAFQDKEWIQLRLRAIFPNTSCKYLVLEGLKVYQNVDNDLKISALTGPSQKAVGEEAEFLATMTNAGLESFRGQVLIELLGDGKMLACSLSDRFRLAPGQNYQRYYTFQLVPEYMGCESYAVRASVKAEGDEVESNNQRSIPFRLLKSVFPVVDDLRASYASDGSGVELNWSGPDLSYGNFETFDFETPFQITDRIGQWKNVDKDGMPEFAINGLRWEGDDQPQAWTVFDAEELGVMNDERLAPHSGTRYVMARATSFDEYSETPVQNSDWLISPEVVGGTKVSFWFGTISSQYTETIRVYYSSTGDNVEDFTLLRPYSKSGDEGWEMVTFTLPAEAKYFAFEYASHGRFAAMIDDVEFTPVQLQKWELDHYALWRHDDGDWSTFHCVAPFIAADATTFTEPTDEVNADYELQGYVVRNGEIYKAPRSNTASIRKSGVEVLDVASEVSVATAPGAILISGPEGLQSAIYGVDGTFRCLVTLRGATARVDIEPGIYIVKTGRDGVKVVVK